MQAFHENQCKDVVASAFKHPVSAWHNSHLIHFRWVSQYPDPEIHMPLFSSGIAESMTGNSLQSSFMINHLQFPLWVLLCTWLGCICIEHSLGKFSFTEGRRLGG
ncbi:hypothetical protein PIB30_037681 [Stylosanthes scabra]|uniref:Uncharacterized protein n=1 Tax=Stylosanthes scabra TaxID=79078 RepID=A0ABU6WC31_9FABA|nr:hypothetical protein [Stylosanthes scabra]